MYLGGKTALLIDDDIECLNLLRKILENVGVHVHTSENLSDAKIKLFEVAPHFIFLDINLAKKNGLYFFTVLSKYSMEIPIFVFSAESEKLWAEPAKMMGAIDFISKPINSHLILEKLKKFFMNDRVYQIDFDDQQAELVTINIEAEISRIGETGAICVSPASFAKNQHLVIYGEILKFLGLKENSLDVVSFQKSRNTGPKRQQTDFHFIGLTHEDEQKIRNKVLRWK